MSSTERVRAWRDRKRKGEKPTPERVDELEWKVKAQAEQIQALEARLAALEARSFAPTAPFPPVPPVAQLAQLRAQIAAVPPVRTISSLHVPNPASVPVQPFGEWEPA